MLRDIRQGATLFILNKKDLSREQAEVLQVVPSTPQFNYAPNGGVMTPPRQTVTIRARYNGKEVVFNNLFADLSSVEDTSNGIVVCENKDALLAEIKAFKMNNDNIVSQIDVYKKNSSWCDEQILQLDPVAKAEVENRDLREIIQKQGEEILGLKSDIKSLLESLGYKNGKD